MIWRPVGCLAVAITPDQQKMVDSIFATRMQQVSHPGPLRVRFKSSFSDRPLGPFSPGTTGGRNIWIASFAGALPPHPTETDRPTILHPEATSEPPNAIAREVQIELLGQRSWTAPPPPTRTATKN